MKVLRTLAGLILAIYSVAVIGFGGTFFWALLRVRVGQPFYVKSDHLFLGLFWIIFGLVALAPCACVVVRRQTHGAWLLLSFGLLVFAGVAIPSNPTVESARGRASFRVVEKLSQVAESIDAWKEKNGRFPANDAELREAVRGALAQPEQDASPFWSAGKQLPYRAVYVGNATGANIGDPGQAPGVIYCAVSADLDRLWLTATEIDRAVGGRVRFVPAWDGTKPMVLEVERRPTTAPAKE